MKHVGVGVTNSDSQSIGGVFLGNLGKFQQGLDHLLHLDLFGFAVADNRTLDLQRRIFKDR